MIPITVYLQPADAAEQYQQLFRQQFYEVPAVGSTIRVFVTDRVDVYVVREVYHDFRSGPQGPAPLPISIVVSVMDAAASPEASPREQSNPGGSWGTEFEQAQQAPAIPRLS